MEALVAEMGSVFEEMHHANYLDHWLRVLRADKRAIIPAAPAARKAAAFLLQDTEVAASAA